MSSWAGFLSVRSCAWSGHRRPDANDPSPTPASILIGDYGPRVVVTDYRNSIRSLAMCTAPEKCFFTASAQGA